MIRLALYTAASIAYACGWLGPTALALPWALLSFLGALSALLFADILAVRVLRGAARAGLL